jgi:hypothetical protein
MLLCFAHTLNGRGMVFFRPSNNPVKELFEHNFLQMLSLVYKVMPHTNLFNSLRKPTTISGL